jgi:hypothetical protein
MEGCVHEHPRVTAFVEDGRTLEGSSILAHCRMARQRIASLGSRRLNIDGVVQIVHDLPFVVE